MPADDVRRWNEAQARRENHVCTGLTTKGESKRNTAHGGDNPYEGSPRKRVALIIHNPSQTKKLL